MFGKAALIVAGSVLVLSGCSSNKYAQDMHQLRSELGMLDQRISQMERDRLSQSASATSTAWPTDTQPPADLTTTPVPVDTAPASVSSKPSKRNIQQALKNAGLYEGTVDGKIGPQTRAAIREFQRTNGLKVDGVVGKQTWDKLAPYLTVASVPASDTTIPSTDASVSK